jgi:lysine 2,3-aminomutase
MPRCWTTSQRTPTVRDVVVSGGDVANLPWKNLEAFLDKLLEIDNIRDIRLATKALMGLPQHWGSARRRRGRRADHRQGAGPGVHVAIHTTSTTPTR